MIYTWTGAKVTSIKEYVTTDENIREETAGMFAEVEIDYDDNRPITSRIVNIVSLRADRGLAEIQKAMGK